MTGCPDDKNMNCNKVTTIKTCFPVFPYRTHREVLLIVENIKIDSLPVIYERLFMLHARI